MASVQLCPPTQPVGGAGCGLCPAAPLSPAVLGPPISLQEGPELTGPSQNLASARRSRKPSPSSAEALSTPGAAAGAGPHDKVWGEGSVSPTPAELHTKACGQRDGSSGFSEPRREGLGATPHADLSSAHWPPHTSGPTPVCRCRVHEDHPQELLAQGETSAHRAVHQTCQGDRRSRQACPAQR